MVLLGVRQVSYRHVVSAAHLLIELFEDRETAVRDVAEDLAAVGRAALAPGEAGFLELVEQTCDAGCRVDHAVPNDERGEAFLAGTAQNAQDIVLLNRHPGPSHDLGKVALDQRGRPENAHGDFGLHGVKWPPLYELRLQPARASFAHRAPRSFTCRCSMIIPLRQASFAPA